MDICIDLLILYRNNLNNLMSYYILYISIIFYQIKCNVFYGDISGNIFTNL